MSKNTHVNNSWQKASKNAGNNEIYDGKLTIQDVEGFRFFYDLVKVRASHAEQLKKDNAPKVKYLTPLLQQTYQDWLDKKLYFASYCLFGVTHQNQSLEIKLKKGFNKICKMWMAFKTIICYFARKKFHSRLLNKIQRFNVRQNNFEHKSRRISPENRLHAQRNA